jgi:uridine kinase
MLREGVRNNDYFRISQRPLSIAVAGDSGSGKDTLASSLAGLFCQNTVVLLSGDDYHLWDRHAPMWKVLTHLNSRGNDLGRFVEDVNTILDGQSIEHQPYDHGNGQFLSPRRLKSNDVIIVSGLHALYHQTLVDRINTCIFLDMAEDLRRHWKIKRDIGARGHSREAIEESLKRRSDDLEQFIRPQKENADLFFGLAPVNPQLLEQEGGQSLRLKLNVVIRNSIHHEQLARILVGLCGMHLNTVYSEVPGEIKMTIEGDLEPEDTALAARELAPHFIDILDIHPKWSGGMTGVMQLVTLVQLESKLKRLK